jgi:hypothetical protein
MTQLSIQFVTRQSFGTSNWTKVEVSIEFVIASSFPKKLASDSAGNLSRWSKVSLIRSIVDTSAIRR